MGLFLILLELAVEEFVIDKNGEGEEEEASALEEGYSAECYVSVTEGTSA